MQQLFNAHDMRADIEDPYSARASACASSKTVSAFTTDRTTP